MPSCARYLALTIAAVATLLGWLQRNGVSDGTLPVLHAGLPWGYVSSAVTSLEGKVALVTGCSSGLGLGVAKRLAAAQATLIVTARDGPKCAATLAQLRTHAPRNGAITCEPLELLSLAKTRAAGAALASRLPRIDLLVLNAGIMMPRTLQLSEDGLEAQFQVNHLAQWLLLKQLTPALDAARARVVTVSSVGHYFYPSSRPPLTSRERLNNGTAYDKAIWCADGPPSPARPTTASALAFALGLTLARALALAGTAGQSCATS